MGSQASQLDTASHEAAQYDQLDDQVVNCLGLDADGVAVLNERVSPSCTWDVVCHIPRVSAHSCGLYLNLLNFEETYENRWGCRESGQCDGASS